MSSTQQRIGHEQVHLRGEGTKWWTAAVITLINALVSSGFSIVGLIAPAALLPPGALVGDGGKLFAMYAAARSLPLAATVVGLMYVRSTSGLGVVAIVLGSIQACDALVGIATHDPGKTFGPAVLAVATLAGARAFFRAANRHP
jgi:hypothetical protein